ncbi:alpha/beta hydrolase [Nocardioides anomalus]|uniref:Alpha/beta hydrolase n=1 Tax=Nocardioides anomalus TaxID=2712223 RepID=A0A6G6W8R6_9ACTN|nr:alpha/beta hydrolase [Nocardioides anomalus]QIG41495.1 alpha/beta hydrolase [Nocardioides anomalus]
MTAAFPVAADGDGPPLLCLHGGPGLSDYLADLGEETAGWRRISYTQRGLAPSPTDGPFTLAQHVADAITVLDDLGLDEAVVLGHSWGGFLAALLAAEHPDRVRGLLLVDPLGVVGDGGFGRFAEQMLARTPDEDRRRADELDRRAMAGQGTEADAVESLRLVWPAYFADPPTAPPMPDLRLGLAAYSATLEEVLALLASGELPARAAACDQPVEVLYGLGSPFPVESALDTAAAFAQGRATGVPDAGHFPWLEQPGCVAEALHRLAQRL